MEGDQVPAAIPKEIINRIPFKKHSLILFVCDAMDLPVPIQSHDSFFLGKHHSSFERIGPRKANGRDCKQIRSAACEFAHPSDEALGIWPL